MGLRRTLERTSRPLKADEIIAQRSAVPAVSLRKRPGDGTADGLIKPKRQRTSHVSHKELEHLRRIADGHKDPSTIEVSEASFDPWDTQLELSESAQDLKFSFLEKAKKKTAPSTLKQKPVSLAANGKPFPAVRKPDGGYSYNPHVTEYLDRVIAEGAKEVSAEQKRIAAEEAERVRQEASQRSAAEAEAAEARAELSEWDEGSAWEGFESGAEELKLNTKRPERNTQAQRNRIKRRKEEERRLQMLANEKKKAEQARRVRKISEEVAAREATRKQALVQLKSDESSDEEGDLELRRRKLGKIAIPEKDLELVLPDELQESLRLLKPEGNLLKDRYRNLLVRGKVESRRPISFAKQAKRKRTEKWTHKDIMLH